MLVKTKSTRSIILSLSEGSPAMRIYCFVGDPSPKFRMTLRVWIRIFLLIILPISNASAEIRDLPFLSVYAASSMTIPLTKIARSYSANHDLTVNVTYDSSSDLAARIQEGSGTDIFISAHPEWIDKLAKQGLVIGERTTLYSNKLAVITASDSPLSSALHSDMPLKDLINAISNRAIMVIGDPETSPLGEYTKETMQQLGLWKKLEPLTIRAANARIALHLIAQGKTVGISYLNDATNDPEVKILSIIPDSMHSPILYQAVIVSEENHQAAKDFIAYLQSDEAKKIFLHDGFKVVGK